MSSIKIYPPNQLPAEGITDNQFAIWCEELEIYLEVEEKFRKFLPDGKYKAWTAAEENPLRIETPLAPDTADDLPQIRRELRQFISIVAKYCHQDYYNPLMKHSTSLEWIYERLRQDNKIEYKGIHFMNIIDLKWDPTGQTTAVAFYNQYRSMIIGNLAKKHDVIEWKNETLKEDDKLNTSYEDLILINVIQQLHPQLPNYIREQYAHKIGQKKRLMDFKTEILTNAKKYIQEIEATQISNISLEEQPACNFVRTRTTFRPQQQRRPQQQQRYQNTVNSRQESSRQSQPISPFCRLCHLNNMPRATYISHYLGQPTCPSLGPRDKQMLSRSTQQLGAVQIQDDDILRDYGYDVDQEDQVKPLSKPIENLPEKSEDQSITACNFIQPVPTQILSLQDKANNDIHVTLDSGATVSYIKLNVAKKYDLKIRPNDQLSKLADGKTKMPAVGEIKETFFRNEWSVIFHAIVVKDLHADIIGGNNFIKENKIIQDFDLKTITVHKKYNVPETSPSLILPTQPNNLLLQNNNISVILPGQSVRYDVPHPDSTTLAVQPWHQSRAEWPDPQLCTVRNGAITLKNDTPNPINLPKSSKIQIRTLSSSSSSSPPPSSSTSTSLKCHMPQQGIIDKTATIEINKQNVDPAIIRYVHDIHSTFKDVFDEDLTQGYNHRFGKHVARLNWASENRPQANKIQNINYDHDTKVLLQKVCDDLTDKGVLGIPQENDIQIQYCSPSFLVRKQKAKNKPKAELDVTDVRLVVNFSKLNDHLKNMPTPVTKPKDIFSTLGKWNHIIVMDLHSGFFQNHMNSEDGQWLGITTPFGGLRYMKRSGQGLIGQSEELDELLAKILKEEMSHGIVARLADDLYVGGRDQQETADNYKRVLSKLQAANIKISPSKTKVFLQSVDVLGWIWKQGGYLSPSPHRVNAIKNTTQTDIKTVKDMRSWLGLYKTLLPASPRLTLLLHPFDLEVADRDSKDDITWTRDLAHHFTVATEAVNELQTLYLPHPEDQLLIEVDAAKVNPGLGHTVYAIKDNKKIPVAFHSVKLSPHHSKWMACELEALAFSTAIQAEYNIIKEAKKPVILSPDSKPVADAIKLIKKGQYSSSPRIQSFINNVNRIPISVQLASGKTQQNISSDYQSRHPSNCEAQHCAICSFTEDLSNSVLLPTCNNIAVDTSSNRQAWKKIQNESKPCREAKILLKSGKTPSKQSGKVNSEIRRLCQVAKVSDEDILIFEAKPNKFSSVPKQLIIIPQTHIPALLWQLHNSMQHPTKSQLKAQFDKMYYGVGLTPALDQLYDDCFFCATQKKIPNVVQHHSKTDATVPGTHFHADVIKRQSQNIFVIRDHISSLSAAKIIKSESHQELKQAIIDLILPLKLQGQTIVRVDNARGFIPLLDDKDHDLKKLHILVQATDVHNKNSNAVVDKACYEIEQGLIRIEPDGRPISNTTLQMAIANLNSKLRRNGQISAFEIHFNRDMNTGQNLNLNYNEIREDQLKTRKAANEKHNVKVSAKCQQKQQPQPGDIVVINKNKDKHKANDVYVVTAADKEDVKVQKILHPHSQQPTLRNQQYITSADRVFVTRRTMQLKQTEQKPQTKPAWTPFRSPTSESDDEDVITVTSTTHVNQQNDNNLHDDQINDDEIAASDHEGFHTPPYHQENSVQPEPEKPDQDHLSSSPTRSRLSSSSSSSSSSYQSPPKTPATIEKPRIYQDHENWLQQQRIHAARQLLLANEHDDNQHEHDDDQREYDHNQHHHPAPPQIDKRTQQKREAKEKIAAIYNRNIPQVDGYLTEPSSSDTSPNISATSSDHQLAHQHYTFYDQVVTDFYDFADRIDFMRHISPTTSQEWDYNYLHCDDDLQHIFAPFDLNSSFLPPARRHTL